MLTLSVLQTRLGERLVATSLLGLKKAKKTKRNNKIWNKRATCAFFSNQKKVTVSLDSELEANRFLHEPTVILIT